MFTKFHLRFNRKHWIITWIYRTFLFFCLVNQVTMNAHYFLMNNGSVLTNNAATLFFYPQKVFFVVPTVWFLSSAKSIKLNHANTLLLLFPSLHHYINITLLNYMTKNLAGGIQNSSIELEKTQCCYISIGYQRYGT